MALTYLVNHVLYEIQPLFEFLLEFITIGMVYFCLCFIHFPFEQFKKVNGFFFT